MSVSILIVDDEPDIAELFRQRFRVVSKPVDFDLLKTRLQTLPASLS
jgi:hypothetical protein